MSWWKTKAWPALKEWGWVLIGLLVAIPLLFRGKRTVVVDPLEKADERHRLEEAHREEALDAEEERLRKELAKINQEYSEETLKVISTTERERYEQLKDDPHALAAWLREVGRRADG